MYVLILNYFYGLSNSHTFDQFYSLHCYNGIKGISSMPFFIVKACYSFLLVVFMCIDVISYAMNYLFCQFGMSLHLYLMFLSYLAELGERSPCTCLWTGFRKQWWSDLITDPVLEPWPASIDFEKLRLPKSSNLLEKPLLRQNYLHRRKYFYCLGAFGIKMKCSIQCNLLYQ